MGFEQFIRERVLWIRSHQLPGWDDVSDLVRTLRWLATPDLWIHVSQSISDDAIRTPSLYVMMCCLLLLVFGVQGRFRRNLGDAGNVAARRLCREFQPTARAAVLTTILSLAWPALPAFLSWRLLADVGGSPDARAVGYGLGSVTAGFLTLNLLRQMCRPAGLGLAHFDWHESSVTLLRAQVYRLMIILLPLLFVANTLHALENTQGRDTLERLLFVVTLILLINFATAVLHPVNGVFREYLAANQDGWTYRLRWPCYWIVLGLPVALAVLAIVGYFYTAYELSWRLYVTTWSLIGLFVTRAFLMRWFVVRHREMRLEQARQRRQTLSDQAQAQTENSNVPQPVDVDTPVDLQEVSDQTQRLIGSALTLVGLVLTWFVWVEVLPALSVLDSWPLWGTLTDASVEYVDEDGVHRFRTEQKLEFITVADALVAVFFVLLTITAGRNIPGLLEITLLNRLPLDAATRYAVRMVARYLIFVVGMVLACGAVGLGWNQVQWLAAALTVGLGFGLQEIFANFVSGLIILVERPVRIGDVVTIGDVSGAVSRIHIRATTITDWDRKEYIVPNKEFVTGRLLNWTLSDTTNRVVIDVGVAYGTDTKMARSLLLQAAGDHPGVLDDPGPVATFEEFADSALTLRLRCYLPNLDNRLGTITELHEAIDRLFTDAEIEISFPQQDIHLRDVPDGLFVAEKRNDTAD